MQHHLRYALGLTTAFAIVSSLAGCAAPTSGETESPDRDDAAGRLTGSDRRPEAQVQFLNLADQAVGWIWVKGAGAADWSDDLLGRYGTLQPQHRYSVGYDQRIFRHTLWCGEVDIAVRLADNTIVQYESLSVCDEPYVALVRDPDAPHGYALRTATDQSTAVALGWDPCATTEHACDAATEVEGDEPLPEGLPVTTTFYNRSSREVWYLRVATRNEQQDDILGRGLLLPLTTPEGQYRDGPAQHVFRNSREIGCGQTVVSAVLVDRSEIAAAGDTCATPYAVFVNAPDSQAGVEIRFARTLEEAATMPAAGGACEPGFCR